MQELLSAIRALRLMIGTPSLINFPKTSYRAPMSTRKTRGKRDASLRSRSNRRKAQRSK